MLNSKRRYHDLQLVDVTQHEVGLDAVGAQSLEVLDVEGRTGISPQPCPGLLYPGVHEVRPSNTVLAKHLDDVHHGRADRDRVLTTGMDMNRLVA